MSEQDKNNDYDSEPVVYCAKCLSLKIKHEDALDIDCCGDCGCTNIIESSIDVWEKRYEVKYGKKFAVKNDDPRNSPIFKLSLSKLMTKVSEYPKWETIIKSVYSHFPKGISKSDSIVMFFDRLIRDNKLSDLRLLLYKMKN
jgi:hypothetical protein